MGYPAQVGRQTRYVRPVLEATLWGFAGGAALIVGAVVGLLVTCRGG